MFGPWSSLTDHRATIQQVSFTEFEKAVELRVRTKYVDSGDASERVSQFSYGEWRPPSPVYAGVSPGFNPGELIVSVDNDAVFDPLVDSCDLQYRRMIEEFDSFESAWEPATPIRMHGSTHSFRDLGMGDYEARVRAVYSNGGTGGEGHSNWVFAEGYPLSEYPPPADIKINTESGLRAHVNSHIPRPGVSIRGFELQTRTVASPLSIFGQVIGVPASGVSGTLAYDIGQVLGVRARIVYREELAGTDYRSAWAYREFDTAFPVVNMVAELRHPDTLVAAWKRPPAPFGINRDDYYEVEFQNITDSLNPGWEAVTNYVPASSDSPSVTLLADQDAMYSVRVRPVYRESGNAEEFRGDWHSASTRKAPRPNPSNLSVGGTSALGKLLVSWDVPPYSFDPSRNSFDLAFRPIPPEGDPEPLGHWNTVVESMIVDSSDREARHVWLLLEVPAGTYEFRLAAVHGRGPELHNGLSDYIYAVGATSTFPPADNLQLSPTEKRGELKAEWGAPANFDDTRNVFRLQFRPAWTDPRTGQVNGRPWDESRYVYTVANQYLFTDLDATLHEVRVSVYYNFEEGIGYARSSDYVLATGTPLGFSSPTEFGVSPTANTGELLSTWTQPVGFNAAVDYYQLDHRTVGYSEEGDIVRGTWLPFPTHLSGVSDSHLLTGLDDGEHEVQLTAVYVDANNAVLSSSIVYYIASPLSAYPAPTEMTVEPTEDTGELRVRWGQPANFRPSTDKYEMDYRTLSTTIDPETGDYAWNPWEPDPPMEVASTARIEMQVLTGLDIKGHEVRVRAKFVDPNDSTVIVCSDYLTATGTPVQAPTPTTAAKFTAEATETAGEISMSWPEPEGFDSSKDKYRIMYARMYQSDNTNRRKVFGSGSWESTETTQPTLKWTSLPGHLYLVAAYWIEVDTEDSDNNVWHSMITDGNAWSGDDELEVYPKPMYPAPSNFQFGHDGTQLAGAWDEPTGFSSNDVYETQYRDVTRDDRASFSSWTEQTSRTWRLSSAAAAGSYDFRVRAKYKNSSGSVLGYSEWLYGEGQVPSSKAGPTNIQMSHGSGSDLWTWDEPADFDPATDFHQWTVRRTNPNKIPYMEWETVRTTALPRFWRNAFAHIPLEMAMRTKYVDTAGNDTYSDWVFVDQPSPEDPADLAYPYPSDLAVDFIQGSDGKYLASWAPPEGFNPLTDGYELQYWNTGSDRAWSSTVELGGTSPGYTLGPVAFQKGWYVQVRTKFVDAENNVNYSGYRVQYFSRPAAEESPTGFSLVEHEEGYRIDLSWTSHSDFDPFSDKYEIEYQDVAWQNSGVPNYYVQVDVISGTSYVMRGLDWDTVYNFRVRASHYDSNGNFEGYSDWTYQSGSPALVPARCLGTWAISPRTWISRTLGLRTTNQLTARAATPSSTASPSTRTTRCASTWNPLRTPIYTSSAVPGQTAARWRAMTMMGRIPTLALCETWPLATTQSRRLPTPLERPEASRSPSPCLKPKKPQPLCRSRPLTPVVNWSRPGPRPPISTPPRTSIRCSTRWDS